MIQILFFLLSTQICILFLLLFKNPCRKLTTMALDRLKRGRGPIIVKTVAATLVVVMGSSAYSMATIVTRSEEIGSLNPTDQVLMSQHLLDCSLLGYTLLLTLIIDRLHHYIKKLRGMRNNMEAITKQNREVEESKSEAVEAKEKEIARLNKQMKLLKSENEAKVKEAEAAEANVLALKKQSEGLLLEYDRLLEDNKSLRDQLQSIDRTLARSDGKKSCCEAGFNAEIVDVDAGEEGDYDEEQDPDFAVDEEEYFDDAEE